MIVLILMGCMTIMACSYHLTAQGEVSRAESKTDGAETGQPIFTF